MLFYNKPDIYDLNVHLLLIVLLDSVLVFSMLGRPITDDGQKYVPMSVARFYNPISRG